MVRQKKTQTSTTADTPASAPVDSESERRRRRLIARDLDEPTPERTPTALAPAPAPETAQEPASEPSRRSRLDGEFDAERPPLRRETKAEEIARYPGRLKRWADAKALVEGRKGHEDEDAEHRTRCELGCDHPAHVLPRREWHEHTPHDLRHLKFCEHEDIRDCPDLDLSHLLPPRPLDPAMEFCCRHRCFPRSDVRSLTECLYLPKRARVRRQLEQQMFGKKAFTH